MARRALVPPIARRRAGVAAVIVLLVLGAALGAAEGAGRADGVGQLRREKARLTEMKRKAEETAAELADTIRREKTTRVRGDALKAKLARKRSLVERIDRKLSALGEDLERAEGDIRELETRREQARHGLRGAASAVFFRLKDRAGAFPPDQERLRYFAGLALASESGRFSRLTEDKDRKETLASGIEHRLADSERTIEREKRLGETLLSRRKAEEKTLADLEARKKRKEKELRGLKARVARMESLVARIERRVREKDRRRTTAPRKNWPSLFSGIPGGLVPPVDGKVVARFGRQRDPDFDVVVDNHGVEIEAQSGSAIRAVGRGEVVFSGSVSGFGKVLILQHGAGLFSVYGKAASYSVGQGRSVAGGEAVGRLPENPDGKSVLYLELRAAGVAIDPASVIALGRR